MKAWHYCRTNAPHELTFSNLMLCCADLVFIGRELLRDPFWVLHAAKELKHDIHWPVQCVLQSLITLTALVVWRALASFSCALSCLVIRYDWAVNRPIPPPVTSAAKSS